MHTFFATLFTLVFAFSHHTAVSHSGTMGELIRPGHFAVQYTPTRGELVRAELVTARYAEAACVSCRRTNPFSSAR